MHGPHLRTVTFKLGLVNDSAKQGENEAIDASQTLTSTLNKAILLRVNHEKHLFRLIHISSLLKSIQIDAFMRRLSYKKIIKLPCSIYWAPNDTSFLNRRLQPNYVQSCQKQQISEKSKHVNKIKAE